MVAKNNNSNGGRSRSVVGSCESGKAKAVANAAQIGYRDTAAGITLGRTISTWEFGEGEHQTNKLGDLT